MSRAIIEVDLISKKYRLGVVGATTLREDLTRLWRQARGQAGENASGEFWALRDVSFSLQAGDVMGIMGRNGAGKSTLLKILSRITEPTAGRAVLRGRIASLLEVGTGFHPDLTGRENVFLNGAILGMRRAEVTARFDEIVSFAQVEPFIDTPVKHYSSGMRMRLAFAVAAHLNSDILVVDEVLAVGDFAFQRQCINAIHALKRSVGKTVLMVSHQLGPIRSLCTRGLILEHGTVAFQGGCEAAVAHYLDQVGPTRDGGEILGRAQRANPSFGQELRISAFTSTPTQLSHSDAAEFHFQLKAARAIAGDGLIIGLGFSTLEGVRLMTIDSDPVLHGPIAAGEIVQLAATLPALPLQPGKYLVDLAVRNGDQTFLDLVSGAIQVTVVAGSKTPPSLTDEFSSVRLSATWRRDHVTPH